jgi:LPS sulfotransferase NodH
VGLKTWLGLKQGPIKEPHNQPPPADWVAPRKTCMIAAISRSGSYLLCSRMHETHVLGYPDEFFSPLESQLRLSLADPTAFRQARLARSLGTGANDVTAIKFVTQHFRRARRWTIGFRTCAGCG